MYKDEANCYRPSSVIYLIDLTVCHDRNPAKTAEPIEILFRTWTRVGPVKHVLDGGCTLAQPGEHD